VLQNITYSPQTIQSLTGYQQLLTQTSANQNSPWDGDGRENEQNGPESPMFFSSPAIIPNPFFESFDGEHTGKVGDLDPDRIPNYSFHLE